MPKGMVRRFQVTVKVYEETVRATHYISCDAEIALKTAIQRLEGIGIVLEKIEDLGIIH
jgi:hypothetical protein